MEGLQAEGAAGEALSCPLSRRRWGRLAWTPGEGKGPRLGHAAPPPPPSLHAPTPFSSPSSCHWGPQSPGHGSTFPCKTPLFPVSSLLPPLQTPSFGPDLGLTLPLWGSRRQIPSVQPHIYQISHGSCLLLNSTRDLPRFPPQSRLPLLSLALLLPNPTPPRQPAGLGSDRVTCPFSLQLDGPPPVALGQCSLVGPSPMHRRHLLLPARVRPAAHTRLPGQPPPRSTHPKPLGLAVHLRGLAGAERKGARAANQHRLLGSSQ